MIMNRSHPNWYGFTYKMQQLDPDDGCKHNFDYAIDVLNTFSGVDIPESLEWFKSNGGYCDCEIIFNCILAEDSNG